MKRTRFIIILVITFLLGVILTHLFYYSNSYIHEQRFSRTIQELREENEQIQKDLDRVDSIIMELN